MDPRPQQGDEEYFEVTEILSEEDESPSGSSQLGFPPCYPSYDVWKGGPRSIAERKGHFLAAMGLRASFSSSSKISIGSGSTPSLDLPIALPLSTVGSRQLSDSGSRSNSNADTLGASSVSEGIDSSLDTNDAFSSSSRSVNSGLPRSGSSGSSSCSCGSNRGAVRAFVDSLINEGKGLEDLADIIQVGGDNSNISLDSSREAIFEHLFKHGLIKKLPELDTDKELSFDKLENSPFCVCPIVQEVLRREKEEGEGEGEGEEEEEEEEGGEKSLNSSKLGSHKKRRGWLESLMEFRSKGHKERGGVHGSGSDKEGLTTNVEKGRKSGFVADEGLESPPKSSKRVKVYVHRKSVKELSELHMRQEFQAHDGAIWSMKFSLDGRYLASAGQDEVVRVWEVSLEQRNKETSCSLMDENSNGFGADDSGILPPDMDSSKNPTSGQKSSSGRKKTQTSSVRQPKLFLVSEKPKCSFLGHTNDILDLSWSKSQTLLSSSMDKTVRLWDISQGNCLKVFTHNDYVTCIQFNPVDDRFFISGSLDGKVRIWSIQDHQVVNWIDFHEMVTTACYTPDGKGAVVGSDKGTCRIYKQGGNKLKLESHIVVKSKKAKRSHGKQITGLQFVPGDESKVLITSSDSRIRIYHKSELICKFKGFRNAKSQISASLSANGRYIVCASEDSRVCIWSYDKSNLLKHSGRWKGNSASYEEFYLRNVLVALPWPGLNHPHPHSYATNSPSESNNQEDSSSSRGGSLNKSTINNGESSPSRASSSCHDSSDTTCARIMDSSKSLEMEELSSANSLDGSCNMVSHLLDQLADNEGGGVIDSISNPECNNNEKSENNRGLPPAMVMLKRATQISGGRIIKGSAKDELPLHTKQQMPLLVDINTETNQTDANLSAIVEDSGADQNANSNNSAWGLVVAAAGLNGEITILQNYGLPVRI